MRGRGFGYLIAAAMLLTCCALTVWHYFNVPVLVLGPMVQQVSTDSFAVFCEIHAGSKLEATAWDAGRIADNGLVSQQKHGRYMVTFAGLKPAREYEYRLRSGQRELARHVVRTAPADNHSFRFLAFGDSGTGGWFQYRLAGLMPTYRPDLILHTGDLIYPRGRLEENPRKFFQPYADVLASVPLYPCLGNHEYKLEGVEPVAEAFLLPPDGPIGQSVGRNYWFDYGMARFVSIDSNSPESFFKNVAAPWLEEVLRTAGNRWQIVFFHAPVYTHGKYEPAAGILKWIVPVLDRHHVELVLCGHNHMYERTHPIRGGRIVPNGQGTVYVTTGAGGANLAHARLPMPDTIAVWDDRDRSFTVVDVTADVINLRQINVWGRQIDQSQVCRRIPASMPAR